MLPSGELTPSDETELAFSRDMDIWKNMMREYAEEMLGLELAGSNTDTWIDFTRWPFLDMDQGLRDGKIQAKILGIGLDPLNWKPEILTVCAFEAEVFDRVFPQIVGENLEGRVVKGSSIGLPFDESTVLSYAHSVRMSPSGAACIRLAWEHRGSLGLD